MAGSRLEPERKNRRVKVMNTKVTPTAHACPNPEKRQRKPLSAYSHLIIALAVMNSMKTSSRFHIGAGAKTYNAPVTDKMSNDQSVRTTGRKSLQNL